MKKTILLSAIILLLLFSCKKGENEPYQTTPYEVTIPFGFPEMQFQNDNPLTVEGVQLGRMLYYDSLLHQTGSRACASCHVQQTGFTTYASNALPHINLGWDNVFLWNGKIEGSLEEVMLFEVEDFFQADMSKLNSDSQYPELFKKVFGVNTITSKEAAYALAQFLRTSVSGNSRYDRVMRNEIFFSDAESNGYEIFFTEKGDCFHCHGAPMFLDYSFHNIGLDSSFTGKELGRYNVTANPYDSGKMATPTLRNIALTAPYMHDGRFQTLEEVVEHYNSGVKHSSTLDPIMTKPGKEFGLQLSALEKTDLVAFLKSLTDTAYILNSALSQP